MFGSPDMIVIGVIKNRLKYLSQNTFDLNYILSQYICNPMIRDAVGENYVKMAIEYVQNNAVHVTPYWNEDMEKSPCVAVAYSMNEDTLYIGDYGAEQHIGDLAPLEFATFSISGFKDDRTCLITPYSEALDGVLWPNVTIQCDGQFFNCIGTKAVDQNIEIYLDSPVPEGIRYDKWKVQTSCRTERAVINASTDAVDVRAVLKTHGDFALHRLMCTIIRYCLKSSRKILDDNGLQIAKFSQGFSSPDSGNENNRYYSTTFSISGKFTEKWIASKYSAGGNLIDVELSATNGENCVDLE